MVWFKSGCSNVLVCTDLAARGLDIKDVKHVVHYQRALTVETFTHRNGRTARWEAEGAVYMLAFENKPLPDFVPDGLEEYTLPKRDVLPPLPDWTTLYVGKGKRDKLSRGDLAGFFMKKGGLRAEELGTIIVFENYSYVADVYPRIGFLAAGDVFTTNTVVKTDDFTAGKSVYAGATGEWTVTEGAGPEGVVNQVYTMPDGQPAIEIEIIKA